MTTKPLVSVIVPTKNSGEFIGACLQSIKDQTYENIETIVVDNNSSDDTPKIAKKLADEFFTKGPERSAQRNYGVSKSNGKYVLIIDSDMELTTDVVAACVDKMQSSDSIKGLVIPEESFGEGFWTQCKKLERSFYVGVDWMEAARFFDRKTFDKLGGYDEDNTGTEDYDLPLRIKHEYGNDSIGRVEEFILHNEQRLNFIRTCRKKFYYAQKLDVYRTKESNADTFRKQSNPLNRYKLFFSKPLRLLRNPFYGVGMLILKTSELLSGASGLLAHKLQPEKTTNDKIYN